MGTLMLGFLAGLAAFLLFRYLAKGASAQGSFKRSFQVNGVVELKAFTRSGDIAIRGGPAGILTVLGKIQANNRWFDGNWRNDVLAIEQNPPVHQAGNQFRIDSLDMRSISIDYEITVPPDTTVHTRTGSGDQRVEHLTGKLDLESDSGDMRLRDIASEVRLLMGSGDVEAHEVSGALIAKTGSGDISWDARGRGDVDVQTGSGDIVLHNINGALVARAGSGEIHASGTQSGPWEVRTGSGDVQIELPAEAAFDLDASTSAGDAVVDRPVVTVVQNELEEVHRRIRGKVGSGGPQLIVHTGSGDVSIR
jgi:DUF4097 and DUF4098 domain-containing protein YvlB